MDIRQADNLSLWRLGSQVNLMKPLGIRASACLIAIFGRTAKDSAATARGAYGKEDHALLVVRGPPALD